MFLATFLVAFAFPQVEDPLPDRIGLGLPLSMAGATGMLAGIVHTASPPAKRDRAIGLGALVGFGIGVAMYLLALLVQLISLL